MQTGNGPHVYQTRAAPRDTWAATPQEAKVRKAYLDQPAVIPEKRIHFLDLKFSTCQISMRITFPPKEFPAEKLQDEKILLCEINSGSLKRFGKHKRLLLIASDKQPRAGGK